MWLMTRDALPLFHRRMDHLFLRPFRVMTLVAERRAFRDQLEAPAPVRVLLPFGLMAGKAISVFYRLMLILDLRYRLVARCRNA